jgi:hypothetical protein
MAAASNKGDLMKKLALLALLALIVPTPLLAQQDDWRNRRAHDGYRVFNRDAFELTPFIGYRYGGTLSARDSNLFNRDVNVASAANYGASLGIPVGNGVKIELLVDRQDTHFTTGGRLFMGGQRLPDFHVTYYQAGAQIPFDVSRNVRPYISIGAGVANLDPVVAGATSSNRFAASAGIGVKVPMNRNLGLKLEAKGFFTSLSNNNNDTGCSFCNNYYDRNLYQGETNFGVYFSF